MKKLTLLLIFFIPLCLYSQDPGVVNLTFNPNPPTEGSTGVATFVLASFSGDIPASSGLIVRVSSGNLDLTTAPTSTIGGISWVFDAFGGEWVGTQMAAILDGDSGTIMVPYTVTGAEFSSAIVNVNLAGVPDEGDGNEILNDQIDLSATIDAILPVKITRFNIDDMNCEGATLAWTSASETNNAGFLIERSFGNLDNFAEVGFVDGAGFSNTEVSYEFTDTYPIDETEAYVYYRLKQVDLDGRSELSDVIKGKRACDFHIEGFAVSPNPASNETFIKSNLDGEELRTASILNNTGQIVEKLKITNSVQRLNLNTYQPGVYSVRMEIDGEVITKRFIKVQ